MRSGSCSAAILDMDGVITRTETVHARAWKQTFDAFLEERRPRAGEDHAPFDVQTDYRRYVDGKPRHDGIRSFLAARGIALPEGDPADGPGADTVQGLGKRKNDIFLELLEREGVETYTDAIEQLRAWRKRGLRTAMITSSRNGQAVVDAAGVRDLFDVIIDGVEAERSGIRGKPAPDVFVEAARRLGVDPGEALVVEDAIAGVEAGRAGGFACVVGVARDGGQDLREHGAHIVVRDLRELDLAFEDPGKGSGAGAPAPPGAGSEAGQGAEASPAPALERFDEIARRLERRRLALFLDYDGTLTPIVRRPEEATLGDEMKARLRDLADRAFVAIVSGRDLDDVRSMVGLEDLHYAGSHGFDIAGPGGLRVQQEEARSRLPELDAAERRLRQELEGAVEGAWVERKRFALAIHFREAAREDEPRVAEIVDRIQREEPGLRKRGGKKIFELQPDVPWDKGRAVLFLLDRLGLSGPDVIPAYVGDDTTDEDAFEALAGRGLTVRVGPPDEPTRAEFFVADTGELARFFSLLADRLGGAGSRSG